MPQSHGQTLAIKLTDAAIKRHMDDPSVRQLRDPRYPLRLRYNTARTRASWFLVRHVGGGDHWRKIGAFPELTSRAVIEQLPDIMARLAVDPRATVGASGWESVGDLLCWYRDRTATDRQRSRSRRSQVRVAIDVHLLPAFEDLPLSEMASTEIDDRLIWPMQSRYAVSTMRQVMGVLKRAYKQAVSVGQLASNPVEQVRLSDFIDARAKPKPGRLRADHLSTVIPMMSEPRMPARMLMLLVLLFGTRISETRLARWGDFDLTGARHWTIPADNVKSRREHRLPLTDMAITIITRYRQWQRARGYRGVYLFPGSQGKPLSDSAAHRWISNASGGEWTSHDLRKLARTAWADLGIDYLVSELLLNHALSDLDRTYIHTYVERQAEDALRKYHDWLDQHGINVVMTETVPRRA